MRLPNLSGLLVASATASLFVLAGHFSADALIDYQQGRQLQELGDVSIRRAEAAVRYGIETLAEITRDQPPTCDPAAMQATRLHIYQRSSVKDIRILEHDGAIRCSAYPDTLEFDTQWPRRDDMLAAGGEGLRIFRVDQFSGTALGVVKDLDRTTSLAAIIGVDKSIFDIMPGDLRDAGAVVLQLSNGQEIARAQTTGTPGSKAGQATITPSDVFPIRTSILVDPAALNNWHREPYWPIVLAAALLGVAFGVLLARIAGRPPDAIDEIDAAIAAKQFKPFVQPLFDLRTGRIVGCESLARWIRADGTVVPPARFIPLAESSGRIDAITWQIVGETLAALQPVLLENPHFKVSVNIVPEHILHPGFADQVLRIASEFRVSPGQIVLEITERQQVEDFARAAAVIADLRRLGFRVALDDVGVGHSGLSSLQALGASIIKIDKFFVDAIGRDAAATAIVGMLVRLANELGMTVVAEGIEHARQREALAACGVQEGQGYLVSPPVAVDRFLALMAKQAKTSDPPALRRVA